MSRIGGSDSLHPELVGWLESVVDQFEKVQRDWSVERADYRRELRKAWREIEFLRQQVESAWDEIFNLREQVHNIGAADAWHATPHGSYLAPITSSSDAGDDDFGDRFHPPYQRNWPTPPARYGQSQRDRHRTRDPLGGPPADQRGRPSPTTGMPRGRRSGVSPYPADDIEMALDNDHSVERARLEQEAEHALATLREQASGRIKRLKSELQKTQREAQEARVRVAQLESSVQRPGIGQFGPGSPDPLPVPDMPRISADVSIVDNEELEESDQDEPTEDTTRFTARVVVLPFEEGAAGGGRGSSRKPRS